MAILTERKVWLERMDKAGKDMPSCWLGFCDAANELKSVANESVTFSVAEARAARAIGIVATVEGALTKTMRNEFLRQYDVLGAPGDFGYDTSEGRAMQAVYDWWNKVVSIRPKKSKKSSDSPPKKSSKST